MLLILNKFHHRALLSSIGDLLNGRLGFAPDRALRSQNGRPALKWISLSSMSFESAGQRAKSCQPAIAFLSPTLCALICAGCANPGPPRPPSLHLPALVTDLTAERAGDHVLLRWTTPALTTDDLAVRGAMTAQICRETGVRPGTPAARLTSCAPILRLAVSPGRSEVSDVLPPALTVDPPILLTYRVQILNSAERSAGDSTAAAFSAAGAAPPPVEDFRATPGEHGAMLEWDSPPGKRLSAVELRRIDLSAPAAPGGPAKQTAVRSISHPREKKKSAATKASEEHSEEVVLRVPETANSTNEARSGAVDPTAKTGDTYTYTAQRVRIVGAGAHPLEIRSDRSPPVTLALRDIFPPARPTGLATISGTTPATGQPASSVAAQVPYIDLSWEPNTEPDLAGYYVYRQQASADGAALGPMVKLMQSITAAPAYRDVAVAPGQRYIYQVTAVDASGNESAPSAKAQELVTTGLNSPN